MRTEFPGFNCCKDFRNNPQLRRCISYSTCFGPTEQTSPGRPSWNVERCWKPSSNQWPAFSLGIMSRVKGKALFELTKSKGMEGIVAKRKDSVYRPGKRSADWLKIKSRPQQEFVVGGFAEGKGSRKHLGALLLGAYRNGQLHYFGHSGSGFSEKGLRDALDRMKPLFTDKSPFENPPRIPEKIQWVKPK